LTKKIPQGKIRLLLTGKLVKSNEYNWRFHIYHLLKKILGKWNSKSQTKNMRGKELYKNDGEYNFCDIEYW